MVKIQDFNKKIFEENLTELGTRFEQHKQALEKQELPEREILKKSIRAWSDALGVPSEVPQSTGHPAKDDLLPAYISEDKKEAVRQILAKLVSTALGGRIEKALSGARKLPPFLEDAFHDALVDKILPEMKKRKMI